MEGAARAPGTVVIGPEREARPRWRRMILVALAVLASTAAGIAAEHRFSAASDIATLVLRAMLFVLVPFVSYVNIAHLRVTVGAGVGVLLAWATVLLLAGVGYVVGRRVLRLCDPALGGLLCSVVIVNSGYLGLPMATTLLGSGSLGAAVAYDQLVNGPALFVLGFGIGAALGTRSGDRSGREDGGKRPLGRRLLTLFTRNPPLLGVVAGLIVSPRLAPAPLPAISHVVVAALLGLGFFAVGVRLSSERREDAARLLERPSAAVGVAIALRVGVAPLILGGLSLLLVRVPHAYLLQAAMPSGVNSLLVGHAYNLDQRLIATVIVWSTILALVVGLGLTLL
jgi:predicted permease